MRSIPFRFDDLFSFGRILGAHDQELPVPDGQAVGDGEWVLAIFEIGRRATASAARGLDKGDGTIWLGFERRDWERLQTFSEAKSEKMKAAAPIAPFPEAPRHGAPVETTRHGYPNAPPPTSTPSPKIDSIPVAVDSAVESDNDPTQFGQIPPPPPPVPRGIGNSGQPPRPSGSRSRPRPAASRPR